MEEGHSRVGHVLWTQGTGEVASPGDVCKELNHRALQSKSMVSAEGRISASYQHKGVIETMSGGDHPGSVSPESLTSDSGVHFIFKTIILSYK